MRKIRPELSNRNPWKLPKHRYYELKHFCLQYNDWKKAAREIQMNTGSIISAKKDSNIQDLTGDNAVKISVLLRNVSLVERAALASESCLSEYILYAVTNDVTYDYLFTVMNIPCSRDMYYDRYRKFFYILSELELYS